MKRKAIYENENSKLVASFDGEIVSFVQTMGDKREAAIYLFIDEFEAAAKFVKNCKRKAGTDQ